MLQDAFCLFSGVTLENIKDILVSIPGVILTIFSFHFAWQKIGDSLSATWSTEYVRTSAARISKVGLVNRKNKPISIFSMHAVINNDIAIELISYEVPLIIKAFESVQVVTPKYSSLIINDEKYQPQFHMPNLVDIYVTTDKKVVKCKVFRPPFFTAKAEMEKFRCTGKETRIYGDKVYDDNCKYAVVYKVNDETYTALVESSGAISDGWIYGSVHIPDEYMKTKELVSEYISNLGFGKIFQNYSVFKLS